MFDFGTPALLALINNAIIVEITYTGQAGDTHIYWDGQCCPSALYADCTVPVEERTWGNVKQLYIE